MFMVNELFYVCDYTRQIYILERCIVPLNLTAKSSVTKYA